MFKKLRRHFFMLNMIIISFVMISSFVAIYSITYQNIMTENIRRLIDIGSGNIVLGGGMIQWQEHDLMGQTTIVHDDVEIALVGVEQQMEGERRDPYLRLIIDHTGDATFQANFVVEGDLVPQLLSQIDELENDQGEITVEGRNWLYSVVTYPTGFRPQEEIVIFTFLDVTESTTILTNLLWTFFIIGFIMLIIIYIVSLFFSKRSVTPIENVFNQQRQFIADASHELKTPLAIITANADVLAESVQSDEERKFTTYIKHQTKRMTGLVNALLTLANHDIQETFTNQNEVNISQLVEHLVLAIEAIAYEKGLQIKTQLESDLWVISDEEKINHILTILFDNAIKYAKKDSTHIVLKLKQDANLITFEMSNQVEEEIKQPERLFDRFYREDAARVHAEGGYGLGLAIAKAMTDELDGKLSVYSEGDWITFRFSLDASSKNNH